MAGVSNGDVFQKSGSADSVAARVMKLQRDRGEVFGLLASGPQSDGFSQIDRFSPRFFCRPFGVIPVGVRNFFARPDPAVLSAVDFDSGTQQRMTT